MKPEVPKPTATVGNIPQQAVSDESEYVHPFIRVVIDAFDAEYARLGLRERLANHQEVPKSQGLVSEFMSLSMTTEFHTFFSVRSLEHLTAAIFKNVDMRSYVLNMTEAVSVASMLVPGADAEAFKDGLVKAIGRTRPKPDEDNTKSLLIGEIVKAIYIDPEEAKGLLDSNFWLVVMYVLLQNLRHSIIFQAMTAKLPSVKSTQAVVASN